MVMNNTPAAIADLDALEILDSRGNPTLSVTAVLDNGVRATAHVPSGASAGRWEALELRDGDPSRYAGKGVRRAVANVRETIAPAVRGMNCGDQSALDRTLRELDGTPNKSRLGANALLGVSCAAARAAARAQGIPLWQWLAAMSPAPPTLPVPMVNILSGGLHAGCQIEFQDFLAIPLGASTFAQALETVVAVHRAVRERLRESGLVITGVADEGGWGPRLASNREALEVLTTAIADAGFEPGRQVAIAIDVAASHFHSQETGLYDLSSEQRRLTAAEMVALIAEWSRTYPVISVEDVLDQDDWDGWRTATSALGDKLQLIGDDFFATNPDRLERGIGCQAANAVLVKMNQIGTLTETFAVLAGARAAGWRAVVSARSGETEDSFLADLAVASGAGQIKVGSITRSERLAKYNRLLAIEGQGQHHHLLLARPFA
jgi:enolase